MKDGIPTPEDLAKYRAGCTHHICKNGIHCTAMIEALNDTTTKGGLNSVYVINRDNGQQRYIGVRYCTTHRDVRGTMLNFCPFCGHNIQWWKSHDVTNSAITGMRA